MHQLRIEKREGGEGVRVWVDTLAGLLGLVEIDVVEVHPWAATVDDIEHPDLLVFDLDPGAGLAWEFVLEARSGCANCCRRKAWKWPKTTGGKGLHLMVPIDRDISHDAARLYCKRLARRLAATDPARYTTSPAPARQAISHRLSAQRARHDGGRRLFPARRRGFRRRAGDVGAGRAGNPPGCIHDRAAAPSGDAAQGRVNSADRAARRQPAAGAPFLKTSLTRVGLGRCPGLSTGLPAINLGGTDGNS